MMKLFKRHSGFIKVAAVGIMMLFVLGACSGSGGFSNMTDTEKGGILGGAGGAALGAIIYHGNPLAGAVIGAAAGVLTGAVAGHFMDERKKDLDKALAPQINAGLVTLQVLKGNVILVTQTGETAFAPGSSVVKQDFISTIQTVAHIMKTYGKMTVDVIGHPDRTGTKAERQALADQRAEAVRTLFLGMGVASALIRSSGNPNSEYLDGRVELVISPVVSK
ncbi:MAG: OmpA family protein [Deltaproteobacteria bacterium]|jgi:outer membrane protein OmpA-like peptidoglycan-associated protein|nr:OmpA family protein [Deltaproteobacteria bacterium]